MEIKLSLPGVERADLSEFTGNLEGRFGHDHFFVDATRRSADAWFVFEDVWPGDNECQVPPDRVYFLTAEASYHLEKFLNDSSVAFFSQFHKVHSCHSIDVPNFEHSPPFLPWMVNSNHDTIRSPHSRNLAKLKEPLQTPKLRQMSMICSDQSGTPEHRRRIAFAEAVNREFGDTVDWFGNGINPVGSKWEALAPYSRTIVLENRFAPGIFTEKIIDAFLAESVPLYWGAPDIEQFLPVRKSHQLNLFDFSGSLKTIEHWLNQPVSRQEREDLQKGKSSALGELHYLHRISVIAHGERSAGAQSRENVILRPSSDFWDDSQKARVRPHLQIGDSLKKLATGLSSLVRKHG